jgi:hypothetical protein
MFALPYFCSNIRQKNKKKFIFGNISENKMREYGLRDPLRWPRDILYPQKLALTSPTSGGRSVGIVLPWTQATEFGLVWFRK